MKKAFILASAMLVLSACGTSKPDQGDQGSVASLQSSGPRAVASSSIDNQRPLIRTDTSQSDEQRVYNTWHKCLHDNGVPGQDVGGGNYKPTEEEGQGPHSAAYTTCRSKQPEDEIDRLKRQNYAEYSDRYHAFIGCLNDAGLQASPDGDGPSVEYPAGFNSLTERVAKIQNNCSATTKF